VKAAVPSTYEKVVNEPLSECLIGNCGANAKTKQNFLIAGLHVSTSFRGPFETCIPRFAQFPVAQKASSANSHLWLNDSPPAQSLVIVMLSLQSTNSCVSHRQSGSGRTQNCQQIQEQFRSLRRSQNIIGWGMGKALGP
jgi:hypothetical protein